MRAQNTSSIGLFYKSVGMLWSVSDCEELVRVIHRRSKWCDTNFLPGQNVIRTFMAKKFWRLVSLFPGDCMDNADKFKDVVQVPSSLLMMGLVGKKEVLLLRMQKLMKKLLMQFGLLNPIRNFPSLNNVTITWIHILKRTMKKLFG